jgi:hypothetical protein
MLAFAATPPTFWAVTTQWLEPDFLGKLAGPHVFVSSTLTGAELVLPSSDVSVRASDPDTVFAPLNVESGVSDVTVGFGCNTPPATATIVPISTTAAAKKPNPLPLVTPYPFRAKNAAWPVSSSAPRQLDARP